MHTWTGTVMAMFLLFKPFVLLFLLYDFLPLCIDNHAPDFIILATVLTQYSSENIT